MKDKDKKNLVLQAFFFIDLKKETFIVRSLAPTATIVPSLNYNLTHKRSAGASETNFHVDLSGSGDN